jgi:hypothetical protein
VRLVTIDCREVGGRPGVMVGDGEILDLTAAPRTLEESQWIPYSVVNVLAAGSEGLEHARRMIDSVTGADVARIETLRSSGALLPYASTALLPPVRRPGLLLVVDADDSTYIKSPNTAVGNAARVDPPWNDDARLTCSGLLAVVIGRNLYRGDPEEASAAIAGYTLVMDFAAGLPDDRATYIESRQFPGASPIGPAIVTADEYGANGDARLQLEINDVEVGNAPALAPSYDIGRRLAALSRRYGFRPGDLVCFRGTLDDATLHAGDAVRLCLDGVMALDVRIA